MQPMLFWERMANNRKIGFRCAMLGIFPLWVLCILTISMADGQGEQTQAYRRAEERFQNIGSVADAVKKVKQGKFGGVHVEEIARAGAVEAIPALKEQFARSLDPSQKDDLDPGNKAEIASALVRLGDKDPIYWDFLVKQANEAIESDAPFPREFDSRGKMLDDHFSPAFLQWAKDQGLSPGDAGQKAVYELPGKLVFLGETGDPRGLPLLRRAMSSSNYMIQIMAAKGLAKLLDKDSIPVIVAACERAPADMVAAIAEALAFYDDPQAQSAAETYLPKELVKALRETRQVPGNDPFFH
jgi:HEAT repeat protein